MRGAPASRPWRPARPFQLLVTYSEWGEGTAAESATDWPSASGHGAYMDVLHDVFTAHPR
ncbi:hypothetical protein ACWD5R_04430 [Streptomyces sp. NPDC002514]|uniref:hypothetical protein n=1 Tax=Streptomyces sp. NPDC001270 TaxID=3364554 RepID=UPI0036876866